MSESFSRSDIEKAFFGSRADCFRVDLPVLTSLLSINITSTGNLDCEALAKKVVNATPASNYITDSVICNSNLASVTTHRAVPTATATAPAHSGGSLGVQRGSMLWIALLGCFLFLL